LSKIPGDVEIYNDIDLDYKSNIITVHFGAFSVIGVYLPHKKKHQLIPFITEIIDSSDKNYIVAGDYNTGINYVDQKGNSFWYEDALKNMETVGMKDAFRHINGSVLEYSWYSHQENGYRYDHTYVAEALLPIVKNCYYLHEYREDGLSDHSPMLLELG
jgi:exonuclease III